MPHSLISSSSFGSRRTHARSAVVDKQYGVTAIVVKRTVAGGYSQSLLTELLHNDQGRDGNGGDSV